MLCFYYILKTVFEVCYITLIYTIYWPCLFITTINLWNVDSYIEKPVSIDLFRARIKSMLSQFNYSFNPQHKPYPKIIKDIESVLSGPEGPSFNLNDYCKTHTLSYKYISKLFKQVVGIGFRDFQNKIHYSCHASVSVL